MNFISRWLADQCLFRQLTAIKRYVDARIIYDNSGSSLQLDDYTYVSWNMAIRKPAHGDCTVYAATYHTDARTNGLEPRPMRGEFMRNGKAILHAWVEVGKYTLDCRFSDVLLASKGGYIGAKEFR